MTDKIPCPWCGAEMFHPRPWQKGAPDMGGYNWTVQAKCRECGALSPKVYGRTQQEAENKLFVTALRRYTPLIKPMTLEEVWKEEDPVYVEGKNGALYIGDFYASMSAKNGWDMQTLGSAKPQLILEDDYGKNWRCWERKPTKEEMEAAKWET